MRAPIQRNTGLEDLKKEIIEVKIDYKVWLRTVKTIALSISIILAIAGFFGYNSYDNLKKNILLEVNSRLSVTDSIIAKLDSNRINDINRKIEQKEKEYNGILKGFEELIAANRSIEEKILAVLPLNEKAVLNIESYRPIHDPNIFEVRHLKSTYKEAEKMQLYVLFPEKADIGQYSIIRLSLLDKNTEYASAEYKMQSRFNNLAMTLNARKGKYKLQVQLYDKTRPSPNCYYTEKVIIIE